MIPVKVISKERISENVSHIYLRLLKKINEPLPGQFIMLWIPGYEEIPMSISGYQSGLLRITVKVRGPTTSYIVREMPTGTYLGIRGPLGRGLSEDIVRGRGLLIAGGVGIAPLLYLVKLYRGLIRESTLVAGFSSSDEVKMLKELIGSVHLDVVTEEGPEGATVVDLITRKYVSIALNYDYYLVSGPKAVLDQVVSVMPKELRGYVLADALMKCGVGFCGSCAIKAFLVCRDGPLVEASEYVRLIY